MKFLSPPKGGVRPPSSNPGIALFRRSAFAFFPFPISLHAAFSGRGKEAPSHGNAGGQTLPPGSPREATSPPVSVLLVLGRYEGTGPGGIKGISSTDVLHFETERAACSPPSGACQEGENEGEGGERLGTGGVDGC